MTATLTRRWPSSLTLADLGRHVVITSGDDVAAGILAVVVQCPRTGPRACPQATLGHSARHTHVIVSAHAYVLADHDGAVLIEPAHRSAHDAVTQTIPLTPPADAHHPRRHDRALALSARAGARVRAGVLGACLATATGRSLTVLVALALMWAGVELAFTVPPTTLAQLLGAATFGAGGGLLIRLWHVATRTQGRS